MLREVSSYMAMDQRYPLFQKYNGHSVFGDMNHAAAQFGGYALQRLCGAGDAFKTAVICLSNENTYATALANAKQILTCDPDAEFLGCDISLDGTWNPCSCEACTAAVAADGVMGFTLKFANRLAGDLKAEYPNVLVTVAAAGPYIQAPATVRPAENVAVRVVLPLDACRFHALGDNKTCTKNADFCAALESWAAVCDHVILVDTLTERAKDITDHERFSDNLLALYDTVQYLKSMGVVGYQQMGYDSYAGEFEAMNAYLLSRLLWNADMTRDEYLAEVDGFLQAYYGAGGAFIRQYMDKIFATEGVTHEGYRNDTSMIFRTDDKNFAVECFRLWEMAIDSADTPAAKKNAEYSAVQMAKPAQSLRDRTYTTYFRNFLVKYGFALS
jgi:hypothetical protein